MRATSNPPAGPARPLDGARAHRRLRLELRARRRAADLTHRQVADRLGWSVSKVVRIENGDVRVAPGDVRRLVELYAGSGPAPVQVQASAAGASMEQLLALARAARYQPWREFRDVFPAGFLRFLSLEGGADRIWSVQPHVLPGLFQTAAYREALLHDGRLTPVPPDRIRRIQESLRRRQSILHGEDPPEVVAFVDESVIRRAVGGPAVIRDQLEHLVELAALPHVTVRVMELAGGVYPGFTSPFVRLEFDDAEDPDVLYLEGVSGDVMVRDDPAGSSPRGAYDLNAHVHALKLLDGVALPVERSVELVLRVLEGLPDGSG